MAFNTTNYRETINHNRRGHGALFCSLQCYYKSLEVVHTKICGRCGVEFKTKRKIIKYCSKACAWRYDRAIPREYNCVVCDKKFEPRRSKSSTKFQIICSSECSEDHIRMRTAGSRHLRNCKTCAREFIVRSCDLAKGGGIYCSLVCSQRVKTRGATAQALFDALDAKLGVKGYREKTFDWLINITTGRKLRLDYYIDNLTVAVEYNGQQHYGKCVNYWDISNVAHLDKVKSELCLAHGIRVLVWPYWKPVASSNIDEFVGSVVAYTI